MAYVHPTSLWPVRLVASWSGIVGNWSRASHPVEALMAEFLLFHHAQGLTAGVRRFADELRAAGHRVHTPDLYDGRTFATLDEGLAHAKEIGFENILERGVRAADDLPPELVYGGF